MHGRLDDGKEGPDQADASKKKTAKDENGILNRCSSVLPGMSLIDRGVTWRVSARTEQTESASLEMGGWTGAGLGRRCSKKGLINGHQGCMRVVAISPNVSILCHADWKKIVICWKTQF